MIKAGTVVFSHWSSCVAQRNIALTSAEGKTPILLVREAICTSLQAMAVLVETEWEDGVTERVFLLFDDAVLWPCSAIENLALDKECEDVFFGKRRLSDSGLRKIIEAALVSGMPSDHKDMLRQWIAAN